MQLAGKMVRVDSGEAGVTPRALQSAEFEVAYSLAKPDRTAAVENMLVGTVVYERVLAEIRRLALEAVSARMQSNKR